jgi:hypothetical protein
MVDGADATDDPLPVDRANGSIPVWLTSLDDFHNWRLRLSRAPWSFCHSCLRAITGSTLVARNAGCTIARNAAPMINTALVPNVRGSAWVTP